MIYSQIHFSHKLSWTQARADVKDVLVNHFFQSISHTKLSYYLKRLIDIQHGSYEQLSWYLVILNLTAPVLIQSNCIEKHQCILQNCLLLCSSEQRKSNRSGMTWDVNNVKIVIIVWTVPLVVQCESPSHSVSLSTLFSLSFYVSVYALHTN